MPDIPLLLLPVSAAADADHFYSGGGKASVAIWHQNPLQTHPQQQQQQELLAALQAHLLLLVLLLVLLLLRMICSIQIRSGLQCASWVILLHLLSGLKWTMMTSSSSSSSSSRVNHNHQQQQQAAVMQQLLGSQLASGC
jgi:cytochrome b561